MSPTLTVTGLPEVWTPVEESLPDLIGNYLVEFTDGTHAVAFLNVMGNWTMSLVGRFYGDLQVHEHQTPRVVAFWHPLPRGANWKVFRTNVYDNEVWVLTAFSRARRYWVHQALERIYCSRYPQPFFGPVGMAKDLVNAQVLIQLDYAQYIPGPLFEKAYLEVGGEFHVEQSTSGSTVAEQMLPGANWGVDIKTDGK